MSLGRRILRIAGAIIAVAVILIVAGIGWRLAHRESDPSLPDVKPTAALVSRGEYLTRIADCAACHNVEGGKPYAGGRAFKLPFGTIYSTNITADAETGIGTWSDDDFVRALHRGIAKDGSHLYPAFPYTSYTAITRDDAVAIKAYLFSLPKVHAPATPNSLGFPFNQRWAMGLWNLAFVDERRFHADPQADAVVNRGDYLANALGHCGECHTPRTLAYSLNNFRPLAGTTLQGWHAYNITSDKAHGIGAWSDQDIASYLTTGHAEGHGSATGPMGEAVDYSLRYLTPDDATALVRYLRTVKPSSAGFTVDPSPPAVRASTAWSPSASGEDEGLGKHIFEGACASCHQWNGQGQQTHYAALAGDRSVNDPKGLNVMQVILSGAAMPTAQGRVVMPAFGKAYSDAEIAAVSNYVIGHFGGKTGEVTAAAVAKARVAQ